MSATQRRSPLAGVACAAGCLLPIAAGLLTGSTACAARIDGSAAAAVPAVPVGRALVRAQGGSTRSAMEVAILVVDGNDARRFGTRRLLIVKPGHHELLIRCNYGSGKRAGADKGYASFDFLANHAYEVDAKIPCVARVVDKTAPPRRLRDRQ